jgi:hypothetical protein
MLYMYITETKDVLVTCTGCGKEITISVWSYMTDKEIEEDVIKNCDSCYEEYMSESDFNPYSRDDESCRCGGAGACIECNPKMFI